MTSSFSGLINIAREGRKKGIFLFLTTQSPCDVPKTLLSQIGTLLIHRLTSIEDLQLIRNHLDEHSQKQIINLNQGEALLTSINLLKDVQLNFDKSDRTHYNQTPLL
ncbi:helicase HerA-like domain-containing protein [Lacticaseibacillus paracasei]|uniref:helicase HerA-like domain-containing protein n=1 Tax=Lacticaseibacillus paracasei TaxID=1597 RepID=UPI001CDCF049|nr:helicase HerA-like domain-containing protein [Lacticaseibacillus paracasei]